MSGFEQAPSILRQFDEVVTVIGQYFEGFVLGVVLGVILFQVARKIKASASWLTIPPVMSFVILPSIHASRVQWTASVVAMLIVVPAHGLKGSIGDFRIRDALKYWRVRIALSVLVVWLLLQLISMVALIVIVVVSVAVIGGLTRSWWAPRLRDLIEEIPKQNNQ